MYSLEGVAQAGVELWGGPHPFTLKALALTKYCTPCIWRRKRNRRVIAVHHPCHPQSAALSLLIHPSRGEVGGVLSYRENARGAEEEEEERLAGDQYDPR